MTASEIAETLVNGNISDARAAIVQGQTQQSAAVLALDVAIEITATVDLHAEESGMKLMRGIERVRRCLTGGS